MGTYTISFPAGNFSNAPFPLMDIAFAGMNINEATSSFAPNPSRGHWELWSFTWGVAANNVNTSNMLSFYTFATSGNASLDGVGDMSDLGNNLNIAFKIRL
jgi:hypothetical protein